MSSFKESSTLPDEFELPEDWVETTLDQLLCRFESGSRPKGGVRGISNGVPSIGGEHLDNNGNFRFGNLKYVPEAFYKTMKRGHIEHGDVLIVKDGATTGKVSLVREDFPYCPAVVNEHVFICRFSTGVFPAFLFYFLFSQEGQNRILNNFRGSAQGGINQSFAPGTIVPLAPLSEQKRIVKKVDEIWARVNEIREHLAGTHAFLKRFRQSVLASACAGRLTQEWRAKSDCASWKHLTIGDVIRDRPRNGYSPRGVSYETDVKSLTLTATTSGRFQQGYFKYLDVNIPQDSHLWLRTNDILIQRSNTAEYVGVSAIYDGPNSAYIYPDLMMKIQAKEDVLPKYLWYSLSNETTRNYFRVNAIGTAGSMPKINQHIVQAAPIELPSIEEQSEIVRRVEAIFKEYDSIEHRINIIITHVDKLIQSILGKAFRGELVPTEAELALNEGREYESASLLLERIKEKQDKLKIGK